MGLSLPRVVLETLVRRPTAKVVKRKKRYVLRVEASMEGRLLGCR